MILVLVVLGSRGGGTPRMLVVDPGVPGVLVVVGGGGRVSDL